VQGLPDKTWDKAAYKTKLDAYATGNKMDISLQATKEDVIAEIKAFAKIVKDLATDAGLK
jgi:hypothetical protein